nr:hypothetical transcript [Hymenolepis microstoma]
MGNNTILYMANTTLQAFNMDPTDEVEICPRDMKINFPIAHLTGATVGLIIGGLITILTGAIGILRGVDSAGMVVDASGNAYEKEGTEAINTCLTLLNLTSSKVNSTYEKLWESIPSYRFIGLCPENISMVGSLMEMQSHLSFLYWDKNGKKRCRIVTISPVASLLTDFLAVVPRNASRPTNISGVKENYMRNITSTSIISELNITYCDNKTRKMGFYLDPIDRKDQPMRIELTWRRKPEYYEDSEFGWSSVGAHLGVLSGIFSLAEVKLHFNGTWLPDAYSDFTKSDLVAESGGLERFRARAGDFYQCSSSRNIPMTTSLLNNSEANYSFFTTSFNTVYVIFTIHNTRLQAFGDLNQNSFMGAGVTCGDDIHADHTITVAIGSTVCAIVLISLIGILLTRLYDRDKELQSYEVEYCKMTNKGLLKMNSPPTYQKYEMKVLNKYTPPNNLL